MSSGGRGCIYWNTTPPPQEGIMADVILGKKYENGNEKREKI
jgi:hypothetical protein